MAKHLWRWCVIGGLALGCAWLSAVETLPIPPEPATARTAGEYGGRPAAGAPRDAVSRRETGLADGQPGASTAPPSSGEPSGEGSTATPPASAAASRWMLRWTVWLQDYLLTCGFLV